MRAVTLLALACLLTFSAPMVAANPVDDGGPFAPVCPFVWDFATVCVGGVLQCFVSVRIMGGDRYCV